MPRCGRAASAAKAFGVPAPKVPAHDGDRGREGSRIESLERLRLISREANTLLAVVTMDIDRFKLKIQRELTVGAHGQAICCAGELPLQGATRRRRWHIRPRRRHPRPQLHPAQECFFCRVTGV